MEKRILDSYILGLQELPIMYSVYGNPIYSKERTYDCENGKLKESELESFVRDELMTMDKNELVELITYKLSTSELLDYFNVA